MTNLKNVLNYALFADLGRMEIRMDTVKKPNPVWTMTQSK